MALESAPVVEASFSGWLASVHAWLFRSPAFGLYASDLLDEAGISLARAERHAARAAAAATDPGVRMLVETAHEHLEQAVASAQSAAASVARTGLGTRRQEASLPGAAAVMASLGMPSCSYARQAMPLYCPRRRARRAGAAARSFL
mmetsp:Transcript_29638/g.81548  ORF Transcript_29638/g.81548 Transcript_29638/m.81548 type:complete len:146 (-) Transcript_29638:125-562(-)